MSNLSHHAVSGLRGTPPWRSIPLWVSNDRVEAYFEIYPAASSPGVAATGEGEQWQWRLCTPDGRVRASGGTYGNVQDCLDAVNALRQSASNARIRHLETK